MSAYANTEELATNSLIIVNNYDGFEKFDFQQNNIIITGKIINAIGESMKGATVKLKDGSKSVLTDLDGKFTIQIPEKGGTLVVSYIGYITQEIKVNKATDLDLLLEEEATAMDEVQIVSFGKQKKRQ